MIIESLIGTVLGGVFRIIPELLARQDKKEARAHELAMSRENRETAKLRAELDLATVKESAEAALGVAEFKAITEVSKLQARKTGSRWADVLNSLVRPLIAYEWLMLVWPLLVIGGGLMMVRYGVDAKDAFLTAFSGVERAFMCTIGSFWFTDRTMRHIFRKK